jgi:hypothetical protein
MTDVRFMKRTFFFLAGLMALLVLVAAILRYVPVPTSLINPKIRNAALRAVTDSQAITLESAEYYMGKGRLPHNAGRRITADTETKSLLAAIFSNDPKFMFPIWGTRYGVGCFVPRHRIICTYLNGAEASIYICFECGNFSVGPEGAYHGMYGGYGDSIKQVFVEKGFEIEDKKKKSNQTIQSTPLRGGTDG